MKNVIIGALLLATTHSAFAQSKLEKEIFDAQQFIPGCIVESGYAGDKKAGDNALKMAINEVATLTSATNLSIYMSRQTEQVGMQMLEKLSGTCAKIGIRISKEKK